MTRTPSVRIYVSRCIQIPLLKLSLGDPLALLPRHPQTWSALHPPVDPGAHRLAHSLALPRGRPRSLADVAEYAAVAAKVVEVIPGAKVGLANFGADGNAVGWDEHVFPMVKGIVDTKARVDFIALSCCEGVSWTLF